MTDPNPTSTAVLITRPQPQADRLAKALRAVMPDGVSVVVSPLMRLAQVPMDLPKGPYGAIILTSEAGAAVAGALRPDVPDLAHCVGQRTAEVARAAGFAIGEVAATGEMLVHRLMAMRHAGRLLYLHGQDVSVPIDRVLEAAGISVDAAAVYAQSETPLSREAKAVLRAKSAVLVPLYSARSARLFFAAAGVERAEIWPCVIAPGVLDAVPEGLKARAIVADAPDGAAMLRAIRQGVAALLP